MLQAGSVLLMGLLLVGCATSAPDGERRVVGDAQQVSIAAGRLDALPLAIAHCARYGRAAQWSHSDGDHSVYTCVPNP